MPTHKAYRLHAFGGPEGITLDDVPIPTPGPSQALVAVGAVGMNPFDWKIREGHVRDHDGNPLALPLVLGVDFMGSVVALGRDTSRLKLGDRVMTMSRGLGAYAEHIAVDEAILARVPASLSDVDAATLPIPALTAWQSLHAAGEPRPGMRILIHGASGTVGAFAVQFAKAAGASVIGTASAKNRGYVMDLGADAFIDYRTEAFEERARDIDLVLDYVLVGGDRDTTNRSWGVLKPGGAVVSVADPTIGASVPEGVRGIFPIIVPDVALLESVAERLAGGRIGSRVARVFDRSRLVEAMEINRAGGTAGRLIVDFKRA